MLDQKFRSAEHKQEIANFIARIVSFNNALKLYQWHVTGEGSYATHIAIDQSLDDLTESVDSLSETSYSLFGDLDIAVPQTKRPEDIILFVKEEFFIIKRSRLLLPEGFEQSILDDFQKTIQQLLYRLERLK